ncbi:MAG: F0F1 ATP synthase subunit delta [Parcubacteria group bacterium]
MRYSSTMYATAFWDVLSTAPEANHGHMIRNFVKLVSKNGDLSRSNTIIEEIQKIYVAKEGGRMIKLEFARKQPETLINQLKQGFTEDDLIQIEINPSLVAGVRVTIDGESELDKTMRRKLTRLFKH